MDAASMSDTQHALLQQYLFEQQMQQQQMMQLPAGGGGDASYDLLAAAAGLGPGNPSSFPGLAGGGGVGGFVDPALNSSPAFTDDDKALMRSGAGPKPNNHLYKTELCRNWEKMGTCPYGIKCQFAHGGHELRASMKNRYRQEICRSFAVNGTCRFGPRCRFLHVGPGSGLELLPDPSPLEAASSLNWGLTAYVGGDALAALLAAGVEPSQLIPAGPPGLDQSHSAFLELSQRLQGSPSQLLAADPGLLCTPDRPAPAAMGPSAYLAHMSSLGGAGSNALQGLLSPRGGLAGVISPQRMMQPSGSMQGAGSGLPGLPGLGQLGAAGHGGMEAGSNQQLAPGFGRMTPSRPPAADSFYKGGYSAPEPLELARARSAAGDALALLQSPQGASLHGGSPAGRAPSGDAGQFLGARAAGEVPEGSAGLINIGTPAKGAPGTPAPAYGGAAHASQLYQQALAFNGTNSYGSSSTAGPFLAATSSTTGSTMSQASPARPITTQMSTMSHPMAAPGAGSFHKASPMAPSVSGVSALDGAAYYELTEGMLQLLTPTKLSATS